jgi:DNA excision repair protein ERCC-3
MTDSDWEYTRMEVLVKSDFSCCECGVHGGPDGEENLIVDLVDGYSSPRSFCRECYREVISSEVSSSDVDEFDDSSGDGSDERVLFFPSRREIVVDKPSSKTKRVLSQAAHLVDSTDTGYMYKVDEEDVWNSPYDSFDVLRDDLKGVVNSWDGGFESRIRDDWERAHQFVLRTARSDGNRFSLLEAKDADVFENVAKRKLEHNTHYVKFLSDTELRVTEGAEGDVKERLYEEGYPVVDVRELDSGKSLDISLNEDISLRDYQRDWVDTFMERNSGVFVGPPGSGKTVAAIGVMSELQGETLIIVPSQELAQQWEDELVSKTSLRRSRIGQYHGNEKRVRPVTIATYDIVSMSRHRKLFKEREWGLVVADEAHRSVSTTWKRFRQIQSKARLGLTATPVREQGDAKEIYSLIGPPLGTDWGKLFDDDWVEQPDMEMIMVPWDSDTERRHYTRAEGTAKMETAAANSKKIDAVEEIMSRHPDKKSLIFVDWIAQGEKFSEALDLPFIYGSTSHSKRQELLEKFKEGEVTSIVISRVGDAGIDLPDAELAIMTSTLGSSRAQTGQRAGRTMRPVGDSQVYVLLTKGSGEEDWGRESTQFLAEKGIDVRKTDWEDFSS